VGLLHILTGTLTESYMKCVFELYAKKKLILTAYLNANHWSAVVIIPKQNMVLYLDSLKSLKTDILLLSLIINE
jgi:Ulp1 family protease